MKPHEYDWSIFFFDWSTFFFKKNATENLLLLSGLQIPLARFASVLHSRIVRLFTHFLLSRLLSFFMLFFQWLVFLTGTFPCFFACKIAELVLHFFSLFYFCIYWHVLTSALRIFLFVCLLVSLRFTIAYAFACLLIFFAVILYSS